MLEFGAFDYPTYSKSHHRITYVDFFSKAELAILHEMAKPERVRNAIDVDHIVKEADFACGLEGDFDLLIANHVIEHVPDLIRWLQNAEKILHPGKGRVFLSVPDKGYTFDFLRPLTRLVDLLQAHEERWTSPSTLQVFESLYYYRPIKAAQIWEKSDSFDQLLVQARFPNARAAWENARAKVHQGKYLDVHCTVFTHQSFCDLLLDLKQAGYIGMQVLHSEAVRPALNEFHILLG